MNHPKPLSAQAVALTVALLAVAAPLRVPAAEPAKPMVLQNVMVKLGRDMQAVTGAISREDWTAVAVLAPGKSHP